MPILAIFIGQGITKERYEALRQEMKWEIQHPIGAIVHAAGFDASGNIHVADVWVSEEAMHEFVSTRLMPAMRKLNIPAPKVEVYPLHNMNAYDGVEQYESLPIMRDETR